MPNSITASEYLIIVDCKKKFAALRDKKGVNFAAGPTNSTEVMSNLSRWICEEQKPKKDPKLAF